MAKLTTIEGIGPVIAQQLKAAGVGSVERLLERGATRQGRRELAERTGIDEKRLLRFVNYADLMRVKGVGGEYAELLEAAGVDTVPELAGRNASNLLRRMMEVNTERRLVRHLASANQVAGWIDQAQGMPRAVHH